MKNKSDLEEDYRSEESQCNKTKLDRLDPFMFNRGQLILGNIHKSLQLSQILQRLIANSKFTDDEMPYQSHKDNREPASKMFIYSSQVLLKENCKTHTDLGASALRQQTCHLIQHFPDGCLITLVEKR